MINVQAIRWTDVRNKENLYIKIDNGNEECLINVGQKTFDQVDKIVNPKTKETKKETK